MNFKPSADQKREYLRLFLNEGPEPANDFLDSISQPAFSIGMGPKLKLDSSCGCEHTFKSLGEAIPFILENNLQWPAEVCIEKSSPE